MDIFLMGNIKAATIIVAAEKKRWDAPHVWIYTCYVASLRSYLFIFILFDDAKI